VLIGGHEKTVYLLASSIVANPSDPAHHRVDDAGEDHADPPGEERQLGEQAGMMSACHNSAIVAIRDGARARATRSSARTEFSP
jgi:hypothetical protein